MMTAVSEYRVYLGAYTGTESGAESGAEGIRLAFADSTGQLQCTDRVAATFDPSFLACSPDGRTLYAVNEVSVGRVVAYEVRADGTLHEINAQFSHGSIPCHLSVHPSGRFLLTAHYGSGELTVHPIGPGGRLSEATHVVQHNGHGADPCRQEGPHVHQVLTAPDGRHVLAVDLGTDSVYTYEFDVDTGHLSLKQEVTLRAGAGPRHLAFHPSGTLLYVVNELSSTMTELEYDPDEGLLTLHETHSMLPPAYTGRSLAAEVVVSVDGRYVFGSNRGHNSIAVFEADDFRLVDLVAAGVDAPRHMALSPDGRILFVAGQESETVRSFEVTGKDLIPVGVPVATPRPACVLPM
jgi:6-phosphogluconolactonase (cycloisomerase 2 family)